MKLCKRNASLVWNVLTLSLYLLLGMLFSKGLTAVETPKLRCVRAWSWGRWSPGPCCFHSVCRDKLVVGQLNPRADTGLKNQVLISSWAHPVRFYKVENCREQCCYCLLVAVHPSFPSLKFEVQVSALTLASPLLHLGKSRSASCWMQWGSGSRTSRGLTQLIFLSLRSYLGSTFCNCLIGLQTLIICINEALSGCFQQLNLCVTNLG